MITLTETDTREAIAPPPDPQPRRSRAWEIATILALLLAILVALAVIRQQTELEPPAYSPVKTTMWITVDVQEDGEITWCYLRTEHGTWYAPMGERKVCEWAIPVEGDGEPVLVP